MEDDQSLLGGAGLSSPSFFSAIQHFFYYAHHYCYRAEISCSSKYSKEHSIGSPGNGKNLISDSGTPSIVVLITVEPKPEL